MILIKHPRRNATTPNDPQRPLTNFGSRVYGPHMDSRTEYERDGVVTWLQTVPLGSHTNTELMDSYDDWADRHEGPTVVSGRALGHHLTTLKVPTWRRTGERGRTLTKRPLLAQYAGLPLRTVLVFAGRLAPGTWQFDGVLDAYATWTSDADLPQLPRPWAAQVLSWELSLDGQTVVVLDRRSRS